MKTFWGLMLVAGAFLLGGCGKEENTTPPPAAKTTGGGYLGTLARGEQLATKTVDATSLNQEIQLFNVQEGRNPTDLNELVAKHYIGALPTPPAGMKFSYDAAHGKASVVPQ
ncbi:MAG TPA: hypothetical protein VGO59_07225 [Verrucomicrobiae bacterium]|jgi:hypothetical protein